MNNNKQKLKELVRHIIKETLEELLGSGLSSNSTFPSQQQQSGMINDPSAPSMDAMNPSEKAKFDREQEKTRRDALKSGEQELKTAKKEADFQKQKLDQAKRFKIPTLQKQIQSLKGGNSGI